MIIQTPIARIVTGQPAPVALIAGRSNAVLWAAKARGVRAQT
jgi:hypothetical protein